MLATNYNYLWGAVCIVWMLTSRRIHSVVTSSNSTIRLHFGINLPSIFEYNSSFHDLFMTPKYGAEANCTQGFFKSLKTHAFSVTGCTIKRFFFSREFKIYAKIFRGRSIQALCLFTNIYGITPLSTPLSILRAG